MVEENRDSVGMHHRPDTPENDVAKDSTKDWRVVDSAGGLNGDRTER